MKRNITSLVKYAFLVCLAIFLLKIFLPRSYDVPPLEKRASTLYMNLPTGSKIGYTMIRGKGKKRPYPIIYLHGGPGGDITDRIIKVLTPLSDDGYDVFLYDQVGSGRSDRLDDIEKYTVERHVQDLQAIIKQL